jgi:SAM-dependent methyltransferase
VTQTDFKYSGSELDSLAEAKNYYAWVLRQFENYVGPTVVEIGAGIGTFSEFVLGIPRVEKLIAIEPADNTYPYLEARFRDNPRVDVRKGYLADHRDSIMADALVAVNVLEHVPDDAEFVRDAFTAVRQGGHLLLFVPALPAIFGTLDVAFEHHRRYTRATLRDVIVRAGWKPMRISYMNMPGIAAWFTAGRILRKTTIAARDARTYDTLVVPWLSRLESIIEPPIGANLLAVAEKPS